MKNNKKSYSIKLPIDLINRIKFIKGVKKGKIILENEISKALYPMVENIEKSIKITKDTYKEARKCPECDSYLVIRKSKKGDFYGCYNFPECKHTTNIK